MLRKRRRTQAQRDSLAYKQSAPLSVGESREQQKLREDLHESAIISAVHDYIWLTRPACQLCCGARRGVGRPDHMHEDPSRAETRGRPPEERFNLIVCGRLCEACHSDVTHNRIRIEFHDPALGFLGPVKAVPFVR